MKASINFEKIGGKLKGIPFYLAKKNKWFIFILFLAMVLYAGYIWYSFIYNPKWDEAKKQDYIKKQDIGVAFNKSKFDSVVAEGQRREREFQRDIPEMGDIFHLKK